MSMFKKLWKGLVNWWNNQKWVIEKFLIPQIKTFVATKIEVEIEIKRNEIVKAIQNYPAKENGQKAADWICDRLEEILKLKK